MLDGEPTAPEDRLTAEYRRVDNYASEEFLLGLGLAVQSCSLEVRRQDVYSLAQCSVGPQASRLRPVSTWVSITLVRYGRYP